MTLAAPARAVNAGPTVPGTSVLRRPRPSPISGASSCAGLSARRVPGRPRRKFATCGFFHRMRLLTGLVQAAYAHRAKADEPSGSPALAFFDAGEPIVPPRAPSLLGFDEADASQRSPTGRGPASAREAVTRPRGLHTGEFEACSRPGTGGPDGIPRQAARPWQEGDRRSDG